MLPLVSVHTYQVRVQTSDVSGAGTDADVYVKLCGTRGDTGKRHLKSSLRGRSNKFESGGVEKFEVLAVALGDVERVVVGHDGDGFGSGWHLHSVTVKDLSAQEGEKSKFYFPCDRYVLVSGTPYTCTITSR